MSLDPAARFLEKKRCHTLLCDLPTACTLEYRFLSGFSGSSSLARTYLTKDQQAKALMKLKKKALEVLLTSLKAAESTPRVFLVEGTRYVVRVLVGCLWPT